MPCAQGGGEGKAAYIDTEGTFRPERIKAIGAFAMPPPSAPFQPLSPDARSAAAERFHLDPDAVLGNVRAPQAQRIMHAHNHICSSCGGARR